MAIQVTAQYNELLHYTTAAGLTGIVSSGRLWATHASFLNDAEEITHFFDRRLADICSEECIRYGKELTQSKEAAKLAEDNGGIDRIAESEAEDVVGFYDAISSLSCLYKHWGFAEEQEVRVVAIPANKELARLAIDDGETRPRKA